MSGNGFSVELYDRNFAATSARGLRLEVERYSAHAVGGPEEAQLRVYGDAGGDAGLYDVLDWLRFWVVIRNANHTAVWWGYVSEAEVVLPALAVGMSVEAVRNKVRAAYTVRGADGSQERGTTAWAEDATSQAKYGVHEETLSLGDVSSVAAAEARRGTFLGLRRWPVRTLRMEKGEAGARLVCRGLWETLGWRSYANALGLIGHDVDTDLTHLVGWELAAANAIGIRQKTYRVHDLEGRFGLLAAGDQVVVSGAAANNGTYTVSGAPGGDEAAVDYTSGSLSFQAGDDVLDGAAGLGFCRVDEMIRITDTASNDQFCWVAQAGTSAIEVREGTIVNEAAGSATIAQGHAIVVAERPVTEAATKPTGSTTTVSAKGQKVAQSFVMGATGWTAAEVMIRCQRLGSPADSLRVSLYSDSGGSPNAQVATGTLDGTDDLGEEMGWRLWTLTTPVALSAGATYWIVVERTGSAASDAAYRVGLEAAASYSGGQCKVWDGSSWAARWVNGEMAFQVWGQEATTEQLRAMLTAGGAWFSSVEIVDASGVVGRQYRDGELSARREVEELLEAGTSNGRRLLGKVTPERIAQVLEEPVSGELDLLLDGAGRLLLATGPALEEGVLPAGRWVRMAMIPASAGSVLDVAPVFVERAEYDVREGRYTALELRSAGPWAG